MERYIELKVENWESQKIGDILHTKAGLTKKQISQAKFRKNGIQKNGKQCRVTEIASAGDVIRVCLETEGIASGSLEIPKSSSLDNSLNILYEDRDILVVNKKAGMVTHPSGMHYQDTLSNEVAGYFLKNRESTRIRSIGRLDKETSGILVFAKNQVAAARLQMQRENGILQKTYLAVVSGIMSDENELKSWQITLPLAPDPENPLKMKASPDGILPGSKEAITCFSVLQTLGDSSLVQVRLKTGRTHQIRVHMASIGHPLLGDTLYNIRSGQKGFQRAALHAWKLCFIHPFTGEKMELEAPLPEDFKEVLEYV